MLDYRIESFLALVEAGTLQKASDRLGLTQPAVSQHIKALEEHYGVPFFDRTGRRLVLNDAGRLLETTARKAGALFTRFRREAASFPGGVRRYRMAVTLTIGEFILPRYLGLYREQNPMIELSVRIENTATVMELLDTGEIDLAVVEGPFDRNRYGHELFMNDEMVYIGNGTCIPDPESPVTVEELQDARLILREHGSGTRIYWERYCLEREIVIPRSAVVMEVGSLGAIKSMAEAGLGCSVMSRRAVEKELRSGSLRTRPFATGELYRDMYFVFRDDDPVPFVREFIRFVRDIGRGT